MKRFLSLLIVVMAFQLSATAQIKIEVTLPDSIVGKAYLQNYVKQALKDLSVNPTDPGVVPPVILPGCEAGPDIRSISNVTSTGSDVLFHGQNVTHIEYEVRRDGGSLVALDSVKPESAVVRIKYPAQPDGTFNLLFRGKNCKSPDSKAQFPIKSNTGGIVPPPDPGTVTPAPDPASVSPLVNLTQGMADHLNLVFRDSSGVRLMSDIAPDNLGDRSKFVYRYLINGDLIDTDTRLKNYVVAGNNPLRVLVGKINRRYKAEGFNKWGTGRPEEYDSGKGWYKLDAAESFSFNTSYAFQTFITKTAQAATGFLNHVPQNYDPSNQQVSWGQIGENITLPKGHFWGSDYKPWGISKTFELGITHLPHHDLPWNVDGNKEVIALKKAGKTFSNFQRIEAVFGRGNNGSKEYWPNGTSKAIWPTSDGLPEDEARQWAWKTDASDAIWLSEMSENVGWQPNSSPMFAHFYPELRKRYEQDFGQRGIPFEIIHNYYWLGGESLGKQQSADYYKQLFRKDPKDLPKTEFSPGGTLSATTMIVEGVYLNAPDMVLRQPTELAFRLEYFKQMGYHAGIALFGVHETRPNNRYKYSFPDGTYYKADKVPLDPNVHIASIFFGHVYGNATFEWGAARWANQKLFDGRPGQGLEGDWFPLGAAEPRNNEFNKLWNGSGDIYGGFTGSADLTYFGHRLFAKTFGVTDGGQRQYLRFRIDGGAWITPANFKADDLIDAYKQGRGFVLAQSKDGKTAWFYHNSFADNKPHVLQVELPNGKTVSEIVAGNGIHAKIQ